MASMTSVGRSVIQVITLSAIALVTRGDRFPQIHVSDAKARVITDQSPLKTGSVFVAAVLAKNQKQKLHKQRVQTPLVT